MARSWEAVALVARARLRRGLWGLLALALVIGVVGGAAMAALAGAGRTGSAFDRLLEDTATVDVSVGLDDSPPGPAFGRKVLSLPQVRSGDTLVGIGSVARGFEGVPRFDEDTAALIGAEHGRLFRELGRLKVEEGRMPRPDRLDEAFADTIAARVLDLEIGSKVPLFVIDFRRFGELNAQAAAAGREVSPEDIAPLLQPVELTIVGTGRSPEQIVGGENSDEDAGLVVSPTFVDRYRDVATFTRVYVDLRDPGDLPAFSSAVQRAFPEEGASLTAAATNAAVFDRSVAPYVRALQIFALVVIVAGFLVLGQAAARQVAADFADAPVLRELGLRPVEVVAVAAARGIGAGIVGALLAVVVAIAASPIFPLGLAASAERAPGVSVDWLVLTLGATVVAVVIAGRALVASVYRVHAARRADQRPPARASRTVDGLSSVGVPPSVVLGIGRALRSDRARGTSVWAVLPGLVAAVLALVAALGFGRSLDHLVSSPDLYGWNWDLSLDGFDLGVRPAPSALDADRDLTAWAPGARGAASVDGQLLPAIGLGAGRGVIEPRITAGRAPAAADEVALGARMLRQLDRSVGDTVTAQTSDGTDRIRYRIVGRTVLPAISLSENVGVAEGVTFTLRGLRRVDPGASTSFILVDVRPGAEVDVVARYGNQLGVSGTQRPREILSYDRVRSTPIVLAVLLALLGAATLTHALVVSVSAGRREIAVLKTLGFTRRQVAVMVASLATTLVGLALVIGVPLGIAAGRWSWELFVGPLGLDAPAVVPIAVVSAVSVGVILFANLIAAVPGRRAARTEPAIVLRSE